MQLLSWILILAGALGAGYAVYRADRRRAVPRPWLTALLRAFTVALALLLLLAPNISITHHETQEPVIVLLQDDSRSVPESLRGDTASFRQHLETLARRLSGKYRVVRWAFGNQVQADTLYHYQQTATDISAVLSRVQEFYGQQNLGAVVLASDGRFNQGINPLFQNLSLKSPLYTVPLGDSSLPKDLRLGEVYANHTVARGSQFEIRADVLAQGCNGYQDAVSLQEPGGSATGAVPLNISGDRYDRSVAFSVLADKPGLHHYVLSIPPANGERNTANNRRDVFVEVVEEKKNVLILAHAPHPDVNAIREALQGLETYTVTVRTADHLPASLSDYQVLILHGLPTNTVQLKGNNKPVWYITASSSDLEEINNREDAVGMNGTAQYQHDAYAAPVGSFSSFSLPAGIQAVADRLPPLSVPNASFRTGPNTSLLFAQKGSDNQPLWALQSGTVPRALLLGEGLWRWRLYEYRYFNQHSVVDECIRQTVTFLAANTSEKPFRVEMPKHVWSNGESIAFNAYLLNASNEPVNTPEALLSITDSAGRKREFSFERAGNAYRLNIGVWAAGSYNYTARCTYNGQALTAAGSFVVQDQPLELMETGADYALLNALAHRYNGRLIPWQQMGRVGDSISASSNIRPLLQSREESMPLINWKWYFFLLLLTATLEWLLRKYWLAQ